MIKHNKIYKTFNFTKISLNKSMSQAVNIKEKAKNQEICQFKHQILKENQKLIKNKNQQTLLSKMDI